MTDTSIRVARPARIAASLPLAVLLVSLTAAVVALLWPAIKAVPFWDDLYTLIAIDTMHARGRLSFAATSDVIAFWRPLELFIDSVLWPIDPVSFAPVKLVAIVLHVVKIAAIVRLVERIVRGAPTAALLAGIVALFHPAAVSAIVQIDTLSESIAAACMAWALVLVLEAVGQEQRDRRRTLCAVAALCAVALLGKESAVPAVAAIPIVGFIAANDRRGVLRDLLALSVALAVIGIAYLAVRAGLGFGRPTSAEGRYDIGFGLNVPKNFAVIAGSLAFVGNSVSLIADRAPKALLGFMPAFFAVGVVGIALLRYRPAFFAIIDGRALLACALMALAATAAPALAPSISEHNAAMPSAAFLACVFAVIVAAARSGNGMMSNAGLASAVLAIVIGALAMHAKALAVAQTSDIVVNARAAIASAAAGKDRLRICMTPAEGTMYSIYRLPADRWLGEEILWARHRFPGKTIDDVGMRGDANGCDVSVPNFPKRA